MFVFLVFSNSLLIKIKFNDFNIKKYLKKKFLTVWRTKRSEIGDPRTLSLTLLITKKGKKTKKKKKKMQ